MEETCYPNCYEKKSSRWDGCTSKRCNIKSTCGFHINNEIPYKEEEENEGMMKRFF